MFLESNAMLSAFPAVLMARSGSYAPSLLWVPHVTMLLGSSLSHFCSYLTRTCRCCGCIFLCKLESSMSAVPDTMSVGIRH